jgi:hypothetical protein
VDVPVLRELHVVKNYDLGLGLITSRNGMQKHVAADKLLGGVLGENLKLGRQITNVLPVF